MDLELENRRAFVAGSSSGIGAGIAEGLAREGCEVIVHGRQQERADEVVAKIRAAGGKAITVIGDLSEMASVDEFAARALETGPIDILINSAGACQDVRDWFEVPMEYWHQQYQISVVYSVQLIRAMVPAMIERGWGRVLNVSSTAAYRGMVRHPEYSASKIANLSVSATLAKRLGNSGVTANTLVSGLVMTEHTERAARVSGESIGLDPDDPDFMGRVLRDVWDSHIPLGRGATMKEMAAAACFLVSGPASFITGATLRVDGGGAGLSF